MPRRTHPTTLTVLLLPLVGICLLMGCSPKPEEAKVDEAPALIEIQGERLDAPLPSNQVAASTAEAATAVEGGSSGFPINETAQKALDSIVGSVPPPANMEAYLNRPPISATAELAKATVDAKGYRRIPFDILRSYEYMIPTLVVDKETEDQLKEQIPDYVMNLDDTKVSIEGYMVPLDIKNEKVKSFILTNSMMLCCFGAMPWINEWIYVEMEADSTADFFNDTVIRVSGVLDVGEEIEDGIVLSLYRMQGQTVESEGKPLTYLFEGYGEY